MSVQIFAGVLDYCHPRGSLGFEFVACSLYGYRPVDVEHNALIWGELGQPIHHCFSKLIVVIIAVIRHKLLSHKKLPNQGNRERVIGRIELIELIELISLNLLALDIARLMQLAVFAIACADG